LLKIYKKEKDLIMNKMEKKKFRIGELAKRLSLETSVIRFWEKEFKIQPKRSDGSQRFYTEDDLAKFTKIKELLHIKKFTIAGAKVALKENHSEFVPTKKSTKSEKVIPSTIEKDIIELHKKLIKLRELL
jgi:DNA-binding transcriptional MerR regulator